MRRSYKTEWLKDDNGNVIGVLLNASACAEHEWGITDLLKTLSIQTTNYQGIESRRASLNQNNCFFKSTKTRSTLIIDDEYSIQYIGKSIKHYPSDLKSYDKKLTGAWCGSAFGIVAYDKEDQLNLKMIYSALKDNDLAIWLGSSGILNRCLVLGIISKIPQDKKDELFNGDIAQNNLEQLEKKLGMRDKLQKKGIKFIALSCRVLSKDNVKSKYNIMYWLNSLDEGIQSNWYTVEELESIMESR